MRGPLPKPRASIAIDELVGVPNRAHEQADQEARVPLAEAAQAARGAERGEVVGETRHGLVGGERAVGEARRDARELDERVDEARRVRGQREHRADADDRGDSRAEARRGLDRLER